MATFTTINPATEAPLETYPSLASADLDRALDQAADAQRRHAETSFAVRADALVRLASALDAGRRRYAELMTAEMGKPVGQAEAEVEKCARLCQYVAEHAEAFLADEPRASPAQRSLVAYRPLGVILAIMPWNFPFWQAIRAAVPALAAGNGMILKHAPNVLGCGNALGELFETAGLGDGLFQHLVLTEGDAGTVIADRRIAGVTLTGSGRAGRAVARQAGEALKPCVLELGGSDAFVVLPDADLDAAVDAAVASRTQNNGESCIAAKRFILHQDIDDAFTERFVGRMSALAVGDPMAAGTDLGPLARPDLRTSLHEQVERAMSQGAQLLTGGQLPEGTGYYYPPTVLGGVTRDMLPFSEELFGPVAALAVARSAEHALELANATPFGLGGAVFTQDRPAGERFARQMQSGAAFVNAMTRSHENLPFGGVKASGYGRELGPHGVRAFTNAQTIWID